MGSTRLLQYSILQYPYAILHYQVPQKTRSDPAAPLRALAAVLPPEALREVVPHYSLKSAWHAKRRLIVDFFFLAAMQLCLR